MATAFPPTAFPPSMSAPAPIAPAIPSGTFVPGTKVQVGGHRVIIEKYLSEGGFAHVYLVRLPKAIDGDTGAVLKRVAVPDKEALASMRTEVETMKKLKGRRQIVTYIDSHASQLKGGGYEVFLLMEYCNGGGLIDFMNTRLQNRLTEPEVLKIFSDVAQGVACMHYLKPPLLHRDLKVENVLITISGSTRRYKLCDFGSTAPPRPAATSAVEGRLIEDDVQKHTTLQYRSPEMIDVYRKQPIDEKSDIWALGVLLYKLCYYKTPFEEQGQMAILNARFKFPGYPSFSDKLKKLIASMLREHPQHRPNIYQVVREASLLRGTDIPIKDIYAGRTQSEARSNQHLPSPEPNVATPPMVGAFQAPPTEEKQSIPDITPMRRGRPGKDEGHSTVAKPNPSPLKGAADDPFPALDSSSANIDDVSARFPALDDFSLLHESGGKVSFDPKPEPAKAPRQDITQRVTHALADDAFAQPKTTSRPPPLQAKPAAHLAAPESSSKSSASQSRPSQRPLSEQTAPQRPSMVSTGTMTSQPPSPTSHKNPASSRPIFRFPPSPSGPRSLSQPRASDAADLAVSSRTNQAVAQRPGLLDHRSRSQILTLDASKPSQPSLELGKRSPYLSGLDNSVHRSKSASSSAPSRVRPSSQQGSSKPNLFRRLSREKTIPAPPSEIEPLTLAATGDLDDDQEEAVKIDSNVDYLKAMEEEEASKRKEKRLSSGSKHNKRSSMPSVSLSGTKSLLAGRFGEAFRKFETSTGPDRRDPSRSPVQGPSDLTPIAGSEATDGRSDDGNVLEESEEVPPEVRRELERRRLSQEEKRVADGAAAYRKRLAEGGDKRAGRGGPNSKAASIQSKVQSLLDESGRASPSPTKTAEGYGHFTDRPPSPSLQIRKTASDLTSQSSSRQTPPLSNGASSLQPRAQQSSDPPASTKSLGIRQPPSFHSPLPTSSLPRQSTLPTDRPLQKPSGPPRPQHKPQALRTGDRPQSPLKPSLLAARKTQTSSLGTTTSMDGAPNNDWETNFSKRYPDLSGLEMVETVIDSDGGGNRESMGKGNQRKEMRIKDV